MSISSLLKLIVSAIVYIGLMLIPSPNVKFNTVYFHNDFSQTAQYQYFKQYAIQQGLTSLDIDRALQGTKHIPKIIDIMNRPGESKPWYEYRKNFLHDTTIQQGLKFRQKYYQDLIRAEKKYGVPSSIILGILGIETGFGQNKGSFITRDALATLTFGYPRRADYFRDELIALIQWSYKEKIEITEIKGSYAGAIGYPQFMPSNISKYAVDFDGNGHIDLRNSAVDSIGSVANYLKQHGWQAKQPIAIAAQYSGQTPEEIVSKELKQTMSYAQLKSKGLYSTVPVPDEQQFSVIELQETDHKIYYLTYPNFRVITTYNKSRMYATAVWQLAEAIEKQSK